MKFVKFLPTIAASLVLAACSTTSDVVSSVADATSNAVNATTDSVKGAAKATTETVKSAANATGETVKSAKNATTNAIKGAKEAVIPSKPAVEMANYLCDVQGKRNQVVSATYAFVNGAPKSVTVMIKNKVVGRDMPLNTAYQDGTQFVQGKKIWTLDTGFSKATVAKTIPVMFTDNNNILARNCEIAK